MNVQLSLWRLKNNKSSNIGARQRDFQQFSTKDSSEAEK